MKKGILVIRDNKPRIIDLDRIDNLMTIYFNSYGGFNSDKSDKIRNILLEEYVIDIELKYWNEYDGIDPRPFIRDYKLKLLEGDIEDYMVSYEFHRDTSGIFPLNNTEFATIINK